MKKYRMSMLGQSIEFGSCQWPQVVCSSPTLFAVEILYVDPAVFSCDHGCCLVSQCSPAPNGCESSEFVLDVDSVTVL